MHNMKEHKKFWKKRGNRKSCNIINRMIYLRISMAVVKVSLSLTTIHLMFSLVSQGCFSWYSGFYEKQTSKIIYCISVINNFLCKFA